MKDFRSFELPRAAILRYWIEIHRLNVVVGRYIGKDKGHRYGRDVMDVLSAQIVCLEHKV